ncbi:hypothetical protein M0802_016634, partial [Mischocyttarus mexicanus]
RIAYTRNYFEGNKKTKSLEESQPRTSSSCSSTSEDSFVHIVEPSSSSTSSTWSSCFGDIKEGNLKKMSETTPVSFVVGEPDPDADEELEFGDSFPIEGNDNNYQAQQLSVPPGLVERRKRLR